MQGETNLTILLKTMKPILCAGEYVFYTVDSQNVSYPTFDPICIFRETEGLTLILSRKWADANRLIPI